MASARYWRLVGISTMGGDLDLSEIALADSSGRITAAVSCSLSPVSGFVAALNDSDAATTCKYSAAALRSGGFALMWDLGAAFNVAGIVLGSSSAAGWPLYADIEYRDSVSTMWTRLMTCWFPGWPGSAAVITSPLQAFASRFVFSFDGPNVDSGAPLPVSVYGSGLSCTDSPAKWTKALKTTGSGHLELTNVSDLTVASASDFSARGARDFVIAAWFYVNGSDTHMLYSHGGPGSGQGWNGAYRQGLLFGYGVRATGKLTVWAGNLNVEGASKFIGLETSALSLAGGWHYVALNCFSNILSLYVDGALKSLSPFSGSFPNTDIAQCRLFVDASINVQGEAWQGGANDGRHSSTNNNRYTGSIDDLCIQIGGTPITSVPSEPLANSTAQPLTIPALGSALAASSPVPAAQVRSNAASRLARDMEFGGRAHVHGDVGIKGISPAPDTMTKSRVRLLRARDGVLARETWSHPVTGAFDFTGLDENTQFIALAQDSTGSYRPVAADQVTPEVPE